MRRVTPGTPGLIRDAAPVRRRGWPGALLAMATAAGLIAVGPGAALASPRQADAAAACTDTWVGGAPKVLWGEAGNWSTGRVPGPSDNVCISAFVFVTARGAISVRSLRLGEESTVIFSGTSARPSPVTIATSVDNLGNVELDNSSLATPQFINGNGLESSGTSVLTTPALRNTGTVSAISGSLKLADSLPQLSRGTLNGGFWEADVGGVLVLPGDVTSLPSGLVVTGTNSAIDDPGGHNALAGLTSIGAQGQLAVASGTLSIAGNLTSTGTITIGSYAGGGTLHVAGTLSLGAGTLSLTGTLSATTVHVGAGSGLSGAGTVAADLVNDGTVEAGGQLQVTGNYTQGSGGTLGAGFNTRLAVAGQATLAGTLLTGADPAPPPGSQGTVVTFSSLAGGFTSHSLGFNLLVKPGEIDAVAQPQIAASAPSVARGGQVTINGGDFGSFTTVTLYLDKVGGPVLGTAQPGYPGSFAAKVTIPSSTTTGTHKIIARGSDGRQAQISITVS